MNKQITRKGVAGYATTFTASIVLAIIFTLSCSGGDDDGGGGSSSSGWGDPNGNAEYEYIKEHDKYYNPDSEYNRCNNGVVEHKCRLSSGDVWYNSLMQECEEHSMCDTDGCRYTNELVIRTFEICGNKLYGTNYAKCEGEVLKFECDNGEWYNSETHYCSGGVKPKERCGSDYYVTGWSERCEGRIVEKKCDNEEWYNPKTHYCAYNSSNPRAVVKREPCGNLYTGLFIFSDYEQRCDNGVIESKCKDNTWINDITQSCDRNTGIVKNKVRCGN
jgi:hypothetical protein